ncbi:MAG TPA: TatD family hydrolase [Rubricoccaceae bacterium]|jgi:TatD DNase family protein
MLVDTHAHLYLAAFDADRDAAVERARAAGVTRILMPPTDVASVQTALDVCDRYAGVWAMAAVHPTSVAEMADGDLDRIEAFLPDPRVVAVGETGLDYYWTRDDADAQRASLAAHARMARSADLPLVLHVRDRGASDECARDVVSVLHAVNAEAGGSALRGVFHCFGGPRWLAAEALSLGFHVGLGGTVTYKKGGVPDAIADVPLERIVLETDAPYLAPTPHRGTRNEPAHVRVVAERLAFLRGISLGEVAEATTAAAEALFGLSTE